MGIFGNLFDFDGDGSLDSLEQAAEFSALMNLLDSEEKDSEIDTDEEL